MNTSYNIIGGGIGGICAALAFQRKSCEYKLFEKVSSITYNEVGLGISANIYPILQEWGVLSRSRNLGGEIKRIIFMDKKLKPFRSLKVRKPALSINRRVFYSLLQNELNQDSVFLNSRRSISGFGREEVVIAADGIHSETRKKIFPSVPIRHSGQILWRGIASLKLPEKFKDTYSDCIGGNIRFAIIHSGGDFYSWYLVIEGTGEPFQNTGVVKEKLAELLKDFHPIAREVVYATDKIYFNQLQDINPADRKGIKWYADNVVFLGDSIHATTPNMANGACLAMEDAYVLVALLHKYGKNFRQAFESYQLLREKKINMVVRQSWLLGKMMHQQNWLLDKGVVFSTRFMPQWIFDKIYSTVLDNESIRKVDAL